jgi:outer membrane protein assembly factor BamD (BamD/ComL family)
MDFQNHLSPTELLMWRFEHMVGLWALLIVPVLAFAAVWLQQRKQQRLMRLAQPEKIKALLSTEDASARMNRRLGWFSALILLVMAMANLQLGKEEESVSSKGSNVVIALDLSNSMLARDVAPDRLERSKRMLSSLAGKFSGDRVALIVFAGRAYVQMPFTTDYGAFEMHLRSVNTEVMPTQGTALGEAISIAMAMPGAGGQKEKVLVLLSDGEDHDSQAIDMAKKAAGQDLIIHTIGVGTDKGGPIPVKTGAGVAYKTDRTGQQIISKLNEDNLKSISSAGGGKYFNINSEKQAIREIVKSIKWSSASTGEERIYRRYKSYFQWFLFPAIIILMLELADLNVAAGLSALLSRLKKRSIASAGIMMMVSIAAISCQKPLNKQEFQAAQLLNEGNVEAAKALFSQSLQADSSARNLYQLGTTYMLAEQYDSMAMCYEAALRTEPDSQLLQKIYFNIGNVAYLKGDFAFAVEAFSEVLLMQPGNYRAQYNLCMALAHINPPDNEDQKQDQNQNEDQQDQGDDQKDQDKKDGDQKKDDADKDQGAQDQKDQKGDEKKEREPTSPGKMSQQDIQRLFDALNQQEKAVQRKVLEKSSDKAGQPYIEKDW